jgi:hypothetical protein
MYVSLSLSLCDLITWALAVRMYVSALSGSSLCTRTCPCVCVCPCVASFSLYLCLCVCDLLGGGPHASLHNNNIGAEGAKHVGAGLAHCPNLTRVEHVCRCPWADPRRPAYVLVCIWMAERVQFVCVSVCVC